MDQYYKKSIYEVCSQRYAYMDYKFETFPVKKMFFFTCHLRTAAGGYHDLCTAEVTTLVSSASVSL